MIERLFRNGMIYDGNVRHSGRSIYPTMPRLNREAYDEVGAVCRNPRGHDIPLLAGCYNVIRRAFRAI